MAAIWIPRFLRALLDVDFTNLVEDDVPAYDATAGKFVNRQRGSGGGGVSKLINLVDVVGVDGAGKAPVSDGADTFTLTDVATQAELDVHAADTTAVHGIADTSALETTSGAQAKADAAQAAAEAASDPAGTAASAVASHSADTTSVHGIADTSALVLTSDSRLSDERTPPDASVTAAKLSPAPGIGDDGKWVRVSGGALVYATPQAADVPITDTGGNFASTDVEGALAELAASGGSMQPLDSDLTAIAALSTTSYGRGLLTLANAAGADWIPSTYLDTDTALAADSDTKVATQKATKAYVDANAGGGSARPDTRLLSFIPDCLAENMPRFNIPGGAGALSGGRAHVIAIPLLGGSVITNVAFVPTTSPTTPTHLWLALLDSSLNVIRQTIDRLNLSPATNSPVTLALDSIPVTAGSRSGSTTVTLTIPTLSETLITLVAVGDSITVSNAGTAAYNGTFTVTAVTATTIQYNCGASATDALSSPFPTVKLASGKCTYTVPSDALYYIVLMWAAGTPGQVAAFSGNSTLNLVSPSYVFTGNTGLTGTCPSPVSSVSGSSIAPWVGVS